ncbi:MAG TPA: ABC transporter permease [Acidimicrobiia bacterium]|nr:ABC transporter permease [Acidimicrobiia bacterium]
MINQIYSEWIKIKSVRSNIILFILSIVFTSIIAGLAMINAENDKTVDEAFLGFLIAQMFFLVIGIQIIGQEYRFKTIRNTLAVTPKRMKVYIAKLLTLVITIFATSTILVIVSLIIAQFALAIQGHKILFESGSSLKFIFLLCMVSVLISLFGFAIGSILRQPVAAIVLSLVWVLIAENLIAGLLTLANVSIFQWMPYWSLVGTLDKSYGEAEGTFSSPYLGLLYSGSVFLVLIIIGGCILEKRDA